MKWTLRVVGCCLAWGGLSCLANTPPTVDGAEPEIVQVQVVPRAIGGKPQAAEPARIRVFVGQGGGLWIGGHFGPLDDLVKSQLNLEHGLAAVHVFPDSPAGKAGIQVHDILLSYDGQKVADVESLIGLIEKAKDKEVEVKVLRGGSEKTFKIKAEKRPDNEDVLRLGLGQAGMPKLFHQPLDDVARWFDKDGVRMLLVKPGVVVPQGVLEQQAFPQDLRVTVSKEGDQPAKITVKRGDKSWEVTEEKLDELPQEIRVFVQPMVQGKGQMRIQVRGLVEEEAVEAEAGKGQPEKDATGEDAKGKLRQRLEIHRRLQVAPGSPRTEVPDIEIEALRRLLRNQAIERLEALPGGGKSEDIQKLQQGLEELRKQLEQLKKQLPSSEADEQP